MRTDRVLLRITSDGTAREGSFVPSEGDQLEIHLANATSGRVELDYTSEDTLAVKVAGDLVFKPKGLRAITLEGALARDLLTDETRLSGSVELAFDKSLAVTATTELVPDTGAAEVGAKVTFRF
jgi:hypothetical protein